MSFWIAVLASSALVVIALRGWYRAWKSSKIEASRRVELPNSAYSSEGVRNQEDRERWGSITVGDLHPLNQEEVQRLLFVVDADGITALSPRDRLFLDNMTIPRTG